MVLNYILSFVLIIAFFYHPGFAETKSDKNLNSDESKQAENLYLPIGKDRNQAREMEVKPLEEGIPELSEIEKLYLDRYKDDRLRQFGYEIFSSVGTYAPAPVGDSYILGPGDQIVIYFWGDPVDVLGLESLYTLEIDREGKVFIPSVGILYAWGKTVADLKKELTSRLSTKFRRFNVDVSVGKLRTFPVYVSGFVKKPGVVRAVGTNTVLDVLALAGGVSKNGTLRNIQLKRKTSKGIETINIDLYDLLIKGEPLDIKVRDGDVIHVPPIGRTAGVAGSVKRPAIYELKDEKTAGELIELAGGFLPSVYSRTVRVLRYEQDEMIVHESRISSDLKNMNVKDGDLIIITSISAKTPPKSIKVEGFIAYPGQYSLDKTKTLKDLLNKVGILPDTNLYYGEIVRRNEPDYEPNIISFAPLDVIEGEFNIDLKHLDIVRFFPKWVYEPIQVSGEVKIPRIVPYYKGITLLDVLREVELKYESRYLKAEIYRQKAPEAVGEFLIEGGKEEKLKEEENQDNSDTSLKKNNDEKGKVKNERKQTNNLISSIETVYLYELLNRGEGNVELSPGDRIVIRKTEPTEKDKSVTILGEVNKPGIYRLKEGMTLYDLILEAGGYTEKAYPKGLIFIRESAKKMQEEHIRIALTALEENLARSEEGLNLAGSSGEERVALELTLRKQRQLLSIIKQKAKLGLGRIALDVPDTLEELKNSESNIPLEDGDYIYVPSEPNYILVLGDVYNQISIPYVEGKPLSYYLQQVGGPGKDADLDNIYVIKANGRVISRRNFDRFFNFSWEDGKLYFGTDFMSMPLDQGDTIVVPAEIKVPVMWRPLIRDVVQIIFQAISTAVLAKRL